MNPVCLQFWLRKNTPFFLGVLLSVLVTPVLFTGLAAADETIQPAALEQIAALLAEKASRSPAQLKISSELLYEIKRRQGGKDLSLVSQLTPTVGVRNDGTVLLDIEGDVDGGLVSTVNFLGGTVVNSHPDLGAMRARLPLEQIEQLAASAAVRFIKPADEYMVNKDDTSEGDVAHAADTARAAIGVDGSGVNIGIMSDSIEALATLQGSGDLPAGVTVLAGQAGSGTSEGSAMMEIVFDLAPGANLFFATAQGGQANFAANILALQAAGCDVIVDDIFYFSEPVFQDGVIAQAVETVNAAGVQYYSSIGNAGNLNDGQSGVWEGDFVAAGSPPPALAGQTVHSFGGTNSNQITQDPPFTITLFWSDPWGASNNDYDLFVLDPTGTTVLRSSTNVQSGAGSNPFESVPSRTNNGDGTFTNINDTGNLLVIVQNAGAAGRYLHLNTVRGRLANGTAGQAAGHACAPNAFGTAAVDVATAGGGVFVGGATNPVETFSSDGPRRVFYDASGNPLTPGDFSSTGGVLRQVPVITATDGVSTATPGFGTFFGTSASAPHAAALGGLLLELDPTVTPAQARTIYTNSALDIEAPGFDRDSGVGLIMADLSLQEINPPPVAVCQDVTLEANADCEAFVTAAMIDAGSFDPDGEAVTLSIDATGPFPLGDTVVTLTVTDELGWSDSCQATVSVIDVTPPEITCPVDVTVECSVAGGVPKDDPQLTAFFAAVAATDNCDADPEITNDAPALFEGPCEASNGVTVVTFTATDDSGNSASCTATVTVIDTTPPGFDTLVLNRDVLWPPNHKMSEIVATIEVSDVCDDDPLVTLVSIASNEPDNANGDGNTTDDIQEAAYGTDDRMFLLRSERRGGGDGRIYTITYSVADCSGNATTAEVEVRVPHSKGAEALAYSGFNMDGTLLLPTMDWTRIVIPAVAGGGSGRMNMRGFTAEQVLDDKILLGNAYDVVAPSAMELTDVNKDGARDILLTFPASAVRKILATELEYGLVGVQFRTAESGGDRIVKDVFALGAPLLWTDFLDPNAKVDDTPRNRSLSAAPNPFNPQTILEFGLEKPERVRLRVYNLRGQMVREIEDASLPAGYHSYTWTGLNQSGGRVASGFYMIRLERESGSEIKKVMLLK